MDVSVAAPSAAGAPAPSRKSWMKRLAPAQNPAVQGVRTVRPLWNLPSTPSFRSQLPENPKTLLIPVDCCLSSRGCSRLQSDLETF
jgi:hypothetical protein